MKTVLTTFLIFQFISLQTLAVETIDRFPTLLKNYCETKKARCEECTRNTPDRIQEDRIFEASCTSYYASNQCEDVKTSLPESERGDVISCDQDKVCDSQKDLLETKCALDGFTFKNIATSSAVGAASGAAVFFAGASGGVVFVGVPVLMYGVSKNAEACAKDIKYKKMAIVLHNLSLMPGEKQLDFNAENKALLNYPCSDLTQFLQTRSNELANKRLERQRWSLEKEAPQSPLEKTRLDVLNSNKCLSQKAKQRRYCSLVSTLVVGVVAGGGSGVVTGKVIKAVATKFAPPPGVTTVKEGLFSDKRLTFSTDQSNPSLALYNIVAIDAAYAARELIKRLGDKFPKGKEAQVQGIIEASQKVNGNLTVTEGALSEDVVVYNFSIDLPSKTPGLSLGGPIKRIHDLGEAVGENVNVKRLEFRVGDSNKMVAIWGSTEGKVVNKQLLVGDHTSHGVGINMKFPSNNKDAIVFSTPMSAGKNLVGSEANETYQQLLNSAVGIAEKANPKTAIILETIDKKYLYSSSTAGWTLIH